MFENKFPVIENDFRFDCTLCGECCRGEMQVFLNLCDLYKIARFQGYKSTNALFEKRQVILKRNTRRAWIPQIKFKKKPLPFCPFLINELTDNGDLRGLCALHPEHKPLICALSPVGRTVDFDNEQITYMLVEPAPDCPGMEASKINTLSDMLEQYQDELKFQERFFKILENMITAEKNTKADYLPLYTFKVDRAFPDILAEQERKFYKMQSK